jgi:predicted DNA-binding transcriptional regulator AlpA
LDSNVLLNEREVAKQLKMSVAWLRKMRYAKSGGGIPYVKLGGAVRYRQSAVDAWVSAQTENAA